MPLRCLDEEGRSLLAFDYTEEGFRQLRSENRKRKHLRFPCCTGEVILKTSRRGLRFFAHRSGTSCTSGPESEAHLYLKTRAVEIARALGYEAATEVGGKTPDGEAWRADVLVEKSDARIAIEIQWSPQSDEETLRRQARYAAAGLKCLWLLRQNRFPVAKDLPAAQISGSLKEGFFAAWPSITGRDRYTLEDYLEAALTGGLRFGLPDRVDACLRLYVGSITCWRERCRQPCQAVTGIEVIFGGNTCDFSLSEIGDYPEIAQLALSLLPQGDFSIKPRWSNTQRRSYLSNGCPRCDTLFGEFFHHHIPPARQTFESPVVLTGELRRAVRDKLSFEQVKPAWGLYRLATLP